MGAKVIADLVREKHISSEEGTYLLGFCNNVSPAFFSIMSVCQDLDMLRFHGDSCCFFICFPYATDG